MPPRRIPTSGGLLEAKNLIWPRKGQFALGLLLLLVNTLTFDGLQRRLDAPDFGGTAK